MIKYIYVCPHCGERSNDLSNLKSDMMNANWRCDNCKGIGKGGGIITEPINFLKQDG